MINKILGYIFLMGVECFGFFMFFHFYIIQDVIGADWDRLDELLPLSIIISVFFSLLIVFVIYKFSEEEKEKNCKNCGKKLEDDYKLCPYCGTAKHICAYCGKELKVGFEVCPYCGKDVYTCSKCNTCVKEEDKKCPNCGLDFKD